MKTAAPLLALLLVVACNSGPRPALPVPDVRPATNENVRTTLPTGYGWLKDNSTNKMDGRREVVLSKFSEEESSGNLLIRCARGVTDVYVVPGQLVDNGNVRLKIDEESPRHQNWREAEGHDAIFSRDAINLAKKLASSKTLLIEYRPLERTPKTLEFKLGGLADQLASVAEACNWAKLDQAKEQAKERARATAALDRLRDANLREALAQYVELCREPWFREKGRWCWYDASDSYFANGGAPKESKDAALDDAVFMAKSGRVFVRQREQIDHELKP